MPITIAHEFQVNKAYMGRFEEGSDIITALEDFCKEREIRHAWVQVIGALSQATISYYEQVGHRYVNRILQGEYEIVSCSGNISIKDGQPFGHLHIALSDTDYQTLAGHLMPGSVKLFAGEFIIQVLDKAHPGQADLARCTEAMTGLALW